jgi:hypothetical protein
VWSLAITKEKFYEGSDSITHEILDFLSENQNQAYSFKELESTFDIGTGDLYYLLTELQCSGYINSRLINGEVFYILK